MALQINLTQAAECDYGSGPRYVSLTEPSFAEGLADFARRVAERFPWADAYTPVNEPLTTAFAAEIVVIHVTP